MTIDIDGHSLTLEAFERVALRGEKISVAKTALERVKKSYETLLSLSESDDSHYGVNTGFGSLKDQKISQADLIQLQVNLLRSHACGVGPMFETSVVRGIMLLSLNSLVKGYSGISPAIILQITALLNKGVHPCIPSQGSVGSSGDLAPLSHYALVLIGENEAEYRGKVMPAAKALRSAGLSPVELGPKSGLALINGTHAMNSVGSVALIKALRLAKTADIALGLSLEALKGSKNAFLEKVHRLRPHPNQMIVAKNILALLKDSRLEERGIEREPIQDAYSLRCAPQVHGASRQVFEHVGTVVKIEYDSVTDNPLVIGKEIISAGHFHGQPLAVAFDYLSIGISELGNIAERRLERLVNPQLSKRLPAFLVVNPGLNSGFMIVQYAAAALASENKSLAHPASVDSIPTSANQEDHVSMGTIAARKAGQIADNVTNILACEILAACQAIDILASQAGLRSPKQILSPALLAAYKDVRKLASHLDHDRMMSPDINLISKLVESGRIVKDVEKACPLA